jgi:hypothetical protein
VIIAALLILAPSPGFSDPLSDATTAYARGDYATALKLVRPLAEKGDPQAQNYLGTMYRDGHGVPQNHMTAVKWYRAAAGQGYAQAQNSLGVMHAHGQGVPQDNIRAYMWFEVATSAPVGRDAKKATVRRDELAPRMTPQQVERARQLAQQCRSSKFKQCD